MNIKSILSMILSICFILINMAIVNADVPIRIKLNDVETKKGAEFKVNVIKLR